jgi:hypothetical protein
MDDTGNYDVEEDKPSSKRQIPYVLSSYVYSRPKIITITIYD